MSDALPAPAELTAAQIRKFARDNQRYEVALERIYTMADAVPAIRAVITEVRKQTHG